MEGFTTAVKAGTDVRRADYQNFLENAGAAAKQEVASRLGLSANLDAVPFEEFLSAARQYATTGEGRATFEKARLLRQQRSGGETAAKYAITETTNNADHQNATGYLTEHTEISNPKDSTEGDASLKKKDYVGAFQKHVDAWDGTTEGFSFVMGETPSYLSELMVSGKKIGKKQVRIDATKVKKY